MNRLIDFLKHKENWPIVVIPLLLLAWGRYGAPALALKSFEALTQYEGIYRDPLPAGDEGEPVVDDVAAVAALVHAATNPPGVGAAARFD